MQQWVCVAAQQCGLPCHASSQDICNPFRRMINSRAPQPLECSQQPTEVPSKQVKAGQACVVSCQVTSLCTCIMAQDTHFHAQPCTLPDSVLRSVLVRNTAQHKLLRACMHLGH